MGAGIKKREHLKDTNNTIQMKEQLIRESFSRQGFMTLLGAKMTSVAPGKIILECALNSSLTQQHGYFHAGVITSLADTACGYAAFSMMPEGATVLTVEFKINFMRPANSHLLRVSGIVLKPGKTLYTCESVAWNDDEQKPFAKMMATIVCIPKE
jgi:uncharacterized protein (TIGR00369 family)